MDAMTLLRKLIGAAGKYKYALVIVLIGMGLMLLPTGEDPAEQPPEETQTAVADDLEARLSQVLSQISGAGRVEVILTLRTGAETVYQSDTQSDQDTERRQESADTVLVEDAQNRETGLVRRVDAPAYRGALVVCQGADQPSVRLAIVEAVACLTGLGADQISVVKMK